jgi:Zn finger protein HypA/HybF involved in hydrogenase expression
MVPHPHLISIFNDLLQSPAKSITIALGELVPLSEAGLRAQWGDLTKGTPLAQTILNVHWMRAEQQCMVCFQKYHPVNKETSCPHCESVGAKILAGEEFYLENVEA